MTNVVFSVVAVAFVVWYLSARLTQRVEWRVMSALVAGLVVVVAESFIVWRTLNRP